MSRKLSVNLFSADSIQDCIDQLTFISESLDYACDEGADKIAKQVNTDASDGYEAQEPNVDVPVKGGMATGGADWMVRNIKDGTGRVTVEALGEDVPFMEFGAGAHFNGTVGSVTPSPHPLANEYGAMIGGYGKGHGKKDKWYGPHYVTYGTPYSASMYNAYVKALDTAKETVEKELNKLI